MSNSSIATTGEPDKECLQRVAIKPSEFCEASANGWFSILEAQFQLANITTNQTKFFTALSSFPANLVQRLAPEIITGRDYDQLRASVLALVERSKPELFESLISGEIMTGRPSAYLSALTRTAQKVGVGEDFIRHRFLQNQPSNIAPVLAAQTTLSLNQLGSLADELQTMTGTKESHSTISAVGTSTVSNSATRNNNSFHSSVKPFRDNQRAKICRAHIYYGMYARNCRPWCQWPNKKNCAIEANSSANSRSNSPARSNQESLNFKRNQ